MSKSASALYTFDDESSVIVADDEGVVAQSGGLEPNRRLSVLDTDQVPRA